MPGQANPFYNSNPPASAAPPSYAPSIPSRPSNNEPAQYGSLADLNRGRTQTNQAYNYTPQPERQGYSSSGFENSVAGSNVGGRRLPPDPRGGVIPDISTPPKRTSNLPERPAPPTTNSFTSRAQSYIPESAQSGFNNAASRVQDGFRGVATQERKSQVVGGLAKAGAGVFKLAGRGVYEIGKFASK